MPKHFRGPKASVFEEKKEEFGIGRMLMVQIMRRHSCSNCKRGMRAQRKDYKVVFPVPVLRGQELRRRMSGRHLSEGKHLY